jgi:multicomponent Na+:H+ antiporter subunit E
MGRYAALLALTALYVLLTGNASPANLLIGALVAGLVLLLLRPEHRAADLKRVPAAVAALARYVALMFYDLTVSGIQVARIVIDPSLPIRPGIVAIPSEAEGERERALSAHAVTLTPGELVLEIDDDGVMYAHVLDASEPESHLLAAQRLRRDLLSKMLP